MISVIITILLATVVMIIAVICFSIGRILTGKNRVQRGTCGQFSERKKKEDHCSLCGSPHSCEKKNDERK